MWGLSRDRNQGGDSLAKGACLLARSLASYFMHASERTCLHASRLHARMHACMHAATHRDRSCSAWATLCHLDDRQAAAGRDECLQEASLWRKRARRRRRRQAEAAASFTLQQRCEVKEVNMHPGTVDCRPSTLQRRVALNSVTLAPFWLQPASSRLPPDLCEAAVSPLGRTNATPPKTQPSRPLRRGHRSTGTDATQPSLAPLGTCRQRATSINVRAGRVSREAEPIQEGHTTIASSFGNGGLGIGAFEKVACWRVHRTAGYAWDQFHVVSAL